MLKVSTRSEITGLPSLDELVAATARGDREAFGRLYEASAGQMFGAAMRLLRSRDLAEEATQEAYLAVWRKAGQYRPERGSAIGWMVGIVRNAAIDRLRKGQPASEVPLDPEMPEAEEEVEKRFLPGLAGNRLRDCLGHLRDQPRRAILLAYYYGFSHAELAKRLDAPTGTVKSWIRRGLGELRECLEG
jgi:RNA polymerase sigma-70 factor (ECF subfamily)